ncbi:MAG: bifunctional tRNA (5-methylaminomethyl-2-thiouridine)(34)-methyltransferase MnmD/FAD-dependent 5-carboxymethylaminomethyl-2-thiouridine(34) oxidoreductase MnmC [Rhodospirillaceae bacterium]
MTADERGRALPAPELTWERGHTPVSARFGDVYYSREGGLLECRHVFLEGNDLPAAWQGKGTFCIAELGFGTGLNFLATWELWQRTHPPGSRLHYLAVEGFPMTPAELRECLAPWRDLSALARALVSAYPEPQRGFHRVFPALAAHERGEVTLTLLFGDAAEMLGQLEAEIDAWFLDGFAPDKNPEMWSTGIFAEMARLSQPEASFATYSVAGAVRRALDAAGFEATRAPGFGAKREMLRGRRRAVSRPASELAPWFARAARGPSRGHAAIIGAGLAGAHVAAALVRRGWQTTIVDRHDAPAREASGSPRAVMAPRLTSAPSLDGRYYAAAWRFALSAVDAGRGHFEHARVGSLQLAQAEEDDRLTGIAATSVLPGTHLARVDPAAASDIAGIGLARGGLFFPQGGWLQPRELCAALLEGTEMRLGAEVATLMHTAVGWRVLDAQGRVVVESDAVVLASALGVKAMAPGAWLPLEARRGQVSIVPTNARAAELRTVLLYGGFLTPAHRGVHALGATFDVEAGTDIRAEDHTRNLDDLAKVAPGLLTLADGAEGFAAVRCMSPDHLPVVGPMPDRCAYLEDFANLRHGHPWARYPGATYQHGLYVLTALGARGVVSAPLAAEMLACHITGEPWPLERDLVTALHPARFLVRELKRREV